MSKKQTTQENILEIADALFKEQGYDNVSVQDICDQAGIAKPTFYYYFPSKEDLLKQYIKPMNIAPYPILRKIFSETSYWKQLWMLTKYSIDDYINIGKDLCAQSMKMLLNTHGGHPYISKDALSITLPIIEEAQKAGEIQNMDSPEELVELLWTQSIGLLLRWCCNDDFDLYEMHFKASESLLNIHPDFRFSFDDGKIE